MKRILAAIGLGLLSSVTTAHASTGNDLLKECKALLDENGSSYDSGKCMGRINTILDLNGTIAKARNEPQFCVPEEATNGQIARVVVKYLEDRPADLHQPATVMLYVALFNTWKCKQ